MQGKADEEAGKEEPPPKGSRGGKKGRGKGKGRIWGEEEDGGATEGSAGGSVEGDRPSSSQKEGRRISGRLADSRKAAKKAQARVNGPQLITGMLLHGMLTKVRHCMECAQSVILFSVWLKCDMAWQQRCVTVWDVNNSLCTGILNVTGQLGACSAWSAHETLTYFHNVCN